MIVRVPNNYTWQCWENTAKQITMTNTMGRGEIK